MTNFERFRNLFFSFADPTVKKYCEELSRNRIWKETDQLGFYQYPKGFEQNDLRFSLLDEAINSSRYETYYDIISNGFSIIDKDFELFEKRVKFNTREAIKGVLSLCMVIADGNYVAYIENRDQPVVRNELKKLLHVATGLDHIAKVTLETHKLDIGKKIIVSKENDLKIKIIDDRSHSSRVVITIEGRNDSGQKDPLRIVSVIMGIFSIMTKDLSYQIQNTEYPCGCDHEWSPSLYPFSDFGLEKISLTPDAVKKIEYFIDKLKTQEISRQ